MRYEDALINHQMKNANTLHFLMFFVMRTEGCAGARSLRQHYVDGAQILREDSRSRS